MIPLYTQEQYKNAGYLDKLQLKCKHCEKTFYKKKVDITQTLKSNPKKKYDFCSSKCFHKSIEKKISVNCTNCGKLITTTPQRVTRSKNNFCSRKCNCTYTVKHKTKGTNRSKLELYIEKNLTLMYPQLHIDYNKTSAINAELDIYIPSLNVAFELNGIFHYEPIFGEKRLNSAIKNDISKSKACFDNQIDLCVIDTTAQKYFKENTSKKYLDIITNIINQRTI